MPRFSFKKLVRDKIVDQQKAAGVIPKWHRLSSADHKRALITKIQEESGEILQAALADVASEIADVQQAIDDLIALYGLSASDIADARKHKNSKYGAFSKGIYVDYVDCDEDYVWVAHYRDDPKRYPEISETSADNN